MESGFRHAIPRTRAIAIATALACALPLLAQAVPADAATLAVCPSCAHTTIQSAVDAADPGDTIDVAAGDYSEAVTIPVTLPNLRLLGAQAGVDARDRTGAETVVTAPVAIGADPAALTVSASGTTVDGFTFRHAAQTAPEPSGPGVVLGGAASGQTVVNNVIAGNTFGLYANSSGAAETVVARNLFDANNQAGSASGNGIYADQAAVAVTVADNEFRGGHASASVNFSRPSGGFADIAIRGNRLVGDNSIALTGVANATVEDNVATDAIGSVVFLAGRNDGVTVAGNEIREGPTTGVSVNTFFSAVPNADVTVAGNTIAGKATGVRVFAGAAADPVAVHGNRIVDNAVGVADDDGGAVDATDNWWGCNAGPGEPGCDVTAGGVAADPWLVLTVAASPATVVSGESGAVTAAIASNSDGQPAGPAPDGTPVDFAAEGGSIAPPAGVLAGGTAGATFTAGPAAGPASASATVDGEVATVALEVAAAPPPEPPASPSPPAPPAPGPAPQPPPEIRPGADLAGTDLSGRNLAGADLRGADLSGADLSRANLSNADLNDADLEGAKLDGAKLVGARLARADLSRVRAVGAVLRRANLSRVRAAGANLTRADLRRAVAIRIGLRRAKLARARLGGAVLPRANLNRVDARGARFARARLQRATLRGADLERADLRAADLWECDLRGADLARADLGAARLRRCDLAGARLGGARTRGARGLSGAAR